jgi:hypothetical protein
MKRTHGVISVHLSTPSVHALFQKAKLPIYLNKHPIIKTGGDVEVWLHHFDLDAKIEICGKLHAMAALPRGLEPVWTLWRR